MLNLTNTQRTTVQVKVTIEIDVQAVSMSNEELKGIVRKQLKQHLDNVNIIDSYSIDAVNIIDIQGRNPKYAEGGEN